MRIEKRYIILGLFFATISGCASTSKDIVVEEAETSCTTDEACELITVIRY